MFKNYVSIEEMLKSLNYEVNDMTKKRMNEVIEKSHVGYGAKGSHTFVQDLEESQTIVEHFCREFGFQKNETKGDDKGVDCFLNDIKVDVKAFYAPKRIKRYKGIFIEAIQFHTDGTQKPGWFNREDKETTHYALYVNVRNSGVFTADDIYLLSCEELKKALCDAMDAGDVEGKFYNNIYGFILPYEYLEPYKVKCYGRRWICEELSIDYSL